MKDKDCLSVRLLAGLSGSLADVCMGLTGPATGQCNSSSISNLGNCTAWVVYFEFLFYSGLNVT